MPTGRIKPKYNATPTAREKGFHLWVMESFPCACGCGGVSEVVHHPLKRHPMQRWRRDHEFVVPMTAFCHMALHGAGSEDAFQPGWDYALKAEVYRARGYEAGQL